MKNLLKGSKCYLAGNLQAQSNEISVSWREDFKSKVKEMGIVTLSPLDKVFINFEKEGKGFREEMFKYLEEGNILEVHNRMKNVRRRDLAMIDFSSFVVVVLNSELPTFGTIEEMSVSQKQNKPIFIVVKPNLKKIPLWIAGMFKPECFFNTLEEVIDKLHKIDQDEEYISQENWRIFEKEYVL